MKPTSKTDPKVSHRASSRTTLPRTEATAPPRSRRAASGRAPAERTRPSSRLNDERLQRAGAQRTRSRAAQATPKVVEPTDESLLPPLLQDVEDDFTPRERRAHNGFARRVMRRWRTARRVTPHDDNPFQHALDETAAVNLRVRTRRARKRISATSLMFAAFTAVFSVFLLVMTWAVLRDLRFWDAQVHAREVQLVALQDQLDVGRKRLAVLQSPKGREEILNSKGYIRPGDRFLLFPSTPEEKREAMIPRNDLSPHPPSMEEGRSTSTWRRAGDTLGQWWRNLTAPAPAKP